jgi:hypothetical protein
MAPDWSFNLLDFPRLLIQPLSNVKSQTFVVAPNPTSQPQLGGATSPTRRISVGQPAVGYGRLHLLGLPGEVRLAIWQAIHYDILLGSEELWFQHPSTAWDGLQLTCRQIHIETANFWPSTIIPQAKVDHAFNQVLSIGLLANFRRLSLELPFSKGRDFYESLALSFGGLAPVLEDLRLFLIGKDKFSVKSFVHGCGLRAPYKKTSSTRLTIDGQYQHELQPVFFALYFLQRLRTLVVNNANYPLLQSMIIKHKLHLEYLHISTDPRSLLHSRHDLEGKLQLIIPPKENYPPTKVLHISANAAVTALQIAAKVSRTLEELNWTVPDASHQWYTWNWLEETVVLLDHLGMYASKLRTLRMCFHASVYEAHYSEGALIGGLKVHLPRLTSLEMLELHIQIKADFSGEEIIFAIPDSLERLYVSDKLISADKLEDLITKRYLSSNSKIQTGDPFEGWTLETLIIDDDGVHSAALASAAQQTAYITPSTVQKYSGAPQGYHTKRKGKKAYVRYDEIIGEARPRTDHIPFRRGKLGFIGYEYDGHEQSCTCDKCDETKLIMLRLNGRLLDRERNNHLAHFDGGLQISPRSHAFARTNSLKDTETSVPDALDDGITRKIMLRKDFIEMVVEDETEGSQKGENGERDSQDAEHDESQKSSAEQIKIRKKEFKTELEDFERIMDAFDGRKYGKGSKHYGYFGKEKEAVGHFEKEMIVMESELPERKWPEDTLVGGKEHWHSGA